MVLSHCLKPDFSNSLTVGFDPKPLVISAVSHLQPSNTPVNTAASLLEIVFLIFFFLKKWIGERSVFFNLMNKEISLPILPIISEPQNPSVPITSKQRHVALFHPGLNESISEGGRFLTWIQVKHTHWVQREHNSLAFLPSSLSFQEKKMLILTHVVLIVIVVHETFGIKEH